MHQVTRDHAQDFSVLKDDRKVCESCTHVHAVCVRVCTRVYVCKCMHVPPCAFPLDPARVEAISEAGIEKLSWEMHGFWGTPGESQGGMLLTPIVLHISITNQKGPPSMLINICWAIAPCALSKQQASSILLLRAAMPRWHAEILQALNQKGYFLAGCGSGNLRRVLGNKIKALPTKLPPYSLLLR